MFGGEDVATIVIDGGCNTKVGFAGEFDPKSVFASVRLLDLRACSSSTRCRADVVVVWRRAWLVRVCVWCNIVCRKSEC